MTHQKVMKKGVNFILKSKLKIYTKDVVKVISLILLSILFLIITIFVKYEPVYIVTLSGKNLGYIEDKNKLDETLNKYMNNKTGTVAVIDIAVMPEYTFDLVSRGTKTSEEIITKKITDTAVFTYKTYAVTLNGEIKAEVATELEAQEVIEGLKTDLNSNIEFELGIVECFSTDKKDESKDSAFNKLNEIKIAKTSEYEAEQAKLEAQRIAAEQARLRALQAQVAVANISGSKGNINGVSLSNPLRISPYITSRYGERGSRRYVHSGVDLATSLGTPIYSIASGTVTFSGWQGSYGNMVIVNHGNGVESYYAHCNTLNVSVGQTVTGGTMIATVGSTGNSTGAHLHLEIRVNGTAVNPQNYLY